MSVLSAAVLALKSILGALLIAAGSAKLADQVGFRLTLTGLGVSKRGTGLAALVISIAEVTLGCASVSNIWPTWVNLAVLVLTMSFFCVSVLALAKAPNLSCRCFGALTDSRFNGFAVIRSLFLSMLAAITFWGSTAIQRSTPASRSSTALLTLVGALVFAAACFQAVKGLERVQRSSA